MSNALLVTVLAVSATRSGYELEQSLIERIPQADKTFRERKQTFKVLIARDRARLKRSNGEDLIVRLDRGEIVQLDILLRSYKRKSFADWRAVWKTANAMYLEQIEGAPLNHPRRAQLIDELTDGPEKWQQVWKLPPGDGRTRLLTKYRLPESPPEIAVSKTKETKTVADTETLRYESTENGKSMGWAYLARSMPFDTRYFEFMELQNWILPELSTELRGRKMRKAGMPLETFMRTRSGVEVKVTTKSIKRTAFDESIFEVPEGYVEQKSKSTFN